VTSIFRLILRTQVTKGRAAALGAVGVIGILLGFALGRDQDVSGPEDVAFGFVGAYGLGLLVPLTALVFAAAALGDPAEDGTLVYLWHRPIARWKIVTAALAAALCIAVPVGVLPTVVAAAATRVGGELVVGAAVASLLAAAAYSGLFLFLGLVVRRALAWGLAYVLIWEGFVARSGTGPARLSILVYARSVLAELGDHDPPRLAASLGAAVVVPLVVAALGVAVTTWTLRRIDVR
jgi:ABC-2 type transport system permease protein